MGKKSEPVLKGRPGPEGGKTVINWRAQGPSWVRPWKGQRWTGTRCRRSNDPLCGRSYPWKPNTCPFVASFLVRIAILGQKRATSGQIPYLTTGCQPLRASPGRRCAQGRCPPPPDGRDATPSVARGPTANAPRSTPDLTMFRCDKGFINSISLIMSRAVEAFPLDSCFTVGIQTLGCRGCVALGSGPDRGSGPGSAR